MREHIHKFQWYYLTFLAIIFAGLGFYYIVQAGYYPIAIVNGDVILAGEMKEEYSAALYYYANSPLTGQRPDVTGGDFQKELRRAVMQELIEKSLVIKGLTDRAGGEADDLVDRKIQEQNIDAQTLDSAARALYGITAADFMRLALIPRAQREVLESRLFLEDKKLDDWLKESAESAKVFIITPEFYWDNGAVKNRG